MDGSRKTFLAISGIAVALLAVRIGFIYHQRHSSNVVLERQEPPVTDDDLVKVRKIYPGSLADVRALIGKPLWVSSPGIFTYFSYAAHHADYSHLIGTLAGADRVDVKDVIEQVAPKSAMTHLPTGNQQVLLVIALPADAGKLFAVPIGYKDASGYTFFLDGYFFYDDPQQMYTHWPAPVWRAIHQHRELPGMSELQTALAIGPVTSVESNDIGNRTVTYANSGTPMTVTFEHNKATSIH